MSDSLKNCVFSDYESLFIASSSIDDSIKNTARDLLSKAEELAAIQPTVYTEKVAAAQNALRLATLYEGAANGAITQAQEYNRKYPVSNVQPYYALNNTVLDQSQLNDQESVLSAILKLKKARSDANREIWIVQNMLSEINGN